MKPVFDTLLVDGARIPKSIVNLLIILALCCTSLAAFAVIFGEPEPPYEKLARPTAPVLPGLHSDVPCVQEHRGMSFVINNPTPQGVRIKFENRYKVPVKHQALFRLYVSADGVWTELTWRDRPAPSSSTRSFKNSDISFMTCFGEPLKPGTYRIVFEIWVSDEVFGNDLDRKGFAIDRTLYLYTDFVIP